MGVEIAAKILKWESWEGGTPNPPPQQEIAADNVHCVRALCESVALYVQVVWTVSNTGTSAR